MLYNFYYICSLRRVYFLNIKKNRLILVPNNKREKLAFLETVLLGEGDGNGSVPRTLVFVKKKSSARWVSKQLRNGPHNISSAEIHGDRSQSQREAALESFRAGKIQVLVATDVAARGLDIAGVEHVVNFDLASTPDEFDSYVHRIGRTGRAGNTGIATSFYVQGYEAKVGCGRIAQSLLRLLTENKQNVPEWFRDLPEIRSGNSGGNKNNKKDKFGGRDVRSNTKSKGGSRQNNNNNNRNNNNNNNNYNNQMQQQQQQQTNIQQQQHSQQRNTSKKGPPQQQQQQQKNKRGNAQQQQQNRQVQQPSQRNESNSKRQRRGGKTQNGNGGRNSSNLNSNSNSNVHGSGNNGSGRGGRGGRKKRGGGRGGRGRGGSRN